MRRLTLALLLALAAVVLAAASVHFVVGPVSVDAGTQLVVSGKISGLGVGDVTILIAADGLASVECTNPAGNVAPGQDTTIQAAGSQTFPSPKNGHLVFGIATLAPTIAPTPACPNRQWAADALDVAFSGGTITVVQGGVIVLTQGL